jgi:hypothetical protein
MELTPAMADALEDMTRRHVPATQTSDRRGRKDPIQCKADLQLWPCEVRRLINFLTGV